MADSSDKYPYAKGLLGFGAPDPLRPLWPVGPRNALTDLLAGLHSSTADPSGSPLGMIASAPSSGLGAMADLFPSPRSNALANFLDTMPPTTKRRAFFSFHFDDIMRVNNVRNAWKIDHPDSPLNRSFQDSSLWESRKLGGDDAVKRLIREGVEYTSAVCVLAGSDTWLRRWVRYEIARA
jgi:antiphage defense system Thoeris ThsB-like protein